jgi:hypothetical protein
MGGWYSTHSRSQSSWCGESCKVVIPRRLLAHSQFCFFLSSSLSCCVHASPLKQQCRGLGHFGYCAHMFVSPFSRRVCHAAGIQNPGPGKKSCSRIHGRGCASRYVHIRSLGYGQTASRHQSHQIVPIPPPYLHGSSLGFSLRFRRSWPTTTSTTILLRNRIIPKKPRIRLNLLLDLARR